jgi:lipopolysaccharide transport system ATP-binding protein
MGPNGAGKSTILKLLSRIMVPNKGSMEIKGRLSALIEVTAGFHPELTGRENVYLNGTILGMRRREIDAKFDEIVEFSGVGEFIDTPVKRYSSGMYSRLGFSVAAHMDPDILLVDEVLSVGDIAFQAKCAQKMRDLLKSGITISLSRPCLDSEFVQAGYPFEERKSD